MLINHENTRFTFVRIDLIESISLFVHDRPLVFDRLNTDNEFKSFKYWFEKKADKISHFTFLSH